MATNSATSYYDALIKMQKLQNTSSKDLQKMVNKSNESQMKFNKTEAATARAWQEKMTKSSHQMEVKDLKKAGLNPVLSANNGGAASYTTSSASTQNESGASAEAALAGAQLSALGNMESSRMNANANIQSSAMTADATRRAAMISATAQEEAAKASAEAQKYSARMSYKSTKYRADKDAEIAKQNRANQRYMQEQDLAYRKWQVINQTASTWAGIVDKNLRNSGIYKAVYGEARSWLKNDLSLNTGNYIKKNASKFFHNKKGTKVTKDNFSLTEAGYRQAKNGMTNLGCKKNTTNCKLYIKAVCFGDNKALAKLISESPYANTLPGYR